MDRIEALQKTLDAFDEFMLKAAIPSIADDLDKRLEIYRSELSTRKILSKTTGRSANK